MDMVTDFHSHILPGVDDGSKSLEESISLLRMEAEQGIPHVVATPHFYARHDTPEKFLKRRTKAEELLREEMAKHSGFPRVSVGAEVAYFRGISESDVLPQLVVPGGKYILLEMPSGPWPESICRELERIRGIWGITPVIAHAERCCVPFKTRRFLQQLSELPVLIQADAEFFLNKVTARMAMTMLKSNQIHLLGSDCHNLTDRKPNLGAAAERIRRKLGQDALSRICEYESQLLNNWD